MSLLEHQSPKWPIGAWHVCHLLTCHRCALYFLFIFFAREWPSPVSAAMSTTTATYWRTSWSTSRWHCSSTKWCSRLCPCSVGAPAVSYARAHAHVRLLGAAYLVGGKHTHNSHSKVHPRCVLPPQDTVGPEWSFSSYLKANWSAVPAACFLLMRPSIHPLLLLFKVKLSLK